MRLIDADALADALFDQRRNYPQWVADTIGGMPDAVVRCKDCKWSVGSSFPGLVVCTLEKSAYINREKDWFCAYGEQKEQK